MGLEKETVNIDNIIEAINHFQCFDYILECADDILKFYYEFERIHPFQAKQKSLKLSYRDFKDLF